MSSPLTVTSLAPLTDELRARIRQIDDRIDLREIDRETSEWLFVQEGSAVEQARHQAAVLAATDGAEVWFSYMFRNLPFASADSLRWVQLLSAGVDRILAQPVQDRVTITNVAGMHATPIGEWVLAFLLMHAKQMPRALDSQRRGRWERYRTAKSLSGATVGIVGLGGIGREVARLCDAFGARVIATRRRATSGESIPHIDAVYPLSELHALLGAADYVVLSMPLTDATRGMIGAAEFDAMRPTGVLVNIARGPVVNWEAMLAALQEERIGAVYTDVTVPEPLPDDDPAWDTPNLIITPHVSGFFPDYVPAAAEIFIDNLQRYVAGEPLRNVVDRELGY
jgi:phosphoglycerate dehydrogenase-like enzyme